MAHRQLLTDEERQALLGIPLDADSMARCFRRLHPSRDLQSGPCQDHRCAPCAADRDDLGRRQNLFIGSAILPLRQAR